jgi:hypothetical protein
MILGRSLNTIFVVACWFAVFSCRTAQPKSSALRSDDNVSQAGQFPATGKPEVLQWVIATPAKIGEAAGYGVWNLDLRTSSEVWCERRCSKFDLVETLDGDFNNLQVVKTPILGKTSPGMLSVNKEIPSGTGASAKKVRLSNVGIVGNSVVLEDVITKDRPNFYAVPMIVWSRMDGAKSTLNGEFVGKKFQIRLDPGAVEPVGIVKDAEPTPAFVMGSMVKESGADGKSTEVFIATKIISPWAE